MTTKQSDGLLLETTDNKQLSDNCAAELKVYNLSETIDALQQQFRQYFKNGNPESLRFCCETFSNLVYKREVLSKLAQNEPFLELLIEMLEGQNDQLVLAVCELICHLSMDLQLDSSVINNSAIFKAMVDVGKAAKKLDNSLVLVAVLKALEYWTLVSEINRKCILDIDGALELVTSCMIPSNFDRRLERSSTGPRVIHNFFQTNAFHTFIFRLFCPSILYKLWDYYFTSFDPQVSFASGRNCEVIRDYLQSVGCSKIRILVEEWWTPLILDNKAIYDLAVKYRPTRFPPRFLLSDPSINFLLIPRIHKPLSWKDARHQVYFTEYELFNPFLPSLTAVQHASSLLANLAKDRFQGHERSMVYFRKNDNFSMLGDEYLDFCALPVSMSKREKLFLQENVCRTLVYLLEKEPEVRAKSAEWKTLLELEKGHRFCESFDNWVEGPLKKNDDILWIYLKLISLRTGYKTTTDKLMLRIASTLSYAIWIAFILIYLHVVSYLYLYIYSSPVENFETVRNLFVCIGKVFKLDAYRISELLIGLPFVTCTFIYLFCLFNFYRQRQFTTRISFYGV